MFTEIFACIYHSHIHINVKCSSMFHTYATFMPCPWKIENELDTQKNDGTIPFRYIMNNQETTIKPDFVFSRRKKEKFHPRDGYHSFWAEFQKYTALQVSSAIKFRANVVWHSNGTSRVEKSFPLNAMKPTCLSWYVGVNYTSSWIFMFDS